MAIIQCKMCGGLLEVSDDQHTVVCEYCGTNQTIPRLDDDHTMQQAAAWYDRRPTWDLSVWFRSLHILQCAGRR